MTEPTRAEHPQKDIRTSSGGSEGKVDSRRDALSPGAEPTGFGWDGLTNSVPMLLLGKAGLATVLAAWLVGCISDPDLLLDTLHLSLTPLAVMVGFGLKHLFGAVKAIVDGVPLEAKDRPVTLLKLISFVGTIGAVLGVLAFNLVPNFDAENLLGLSWYWVHRGLGGFVLMWVVLAFTLLIRFPFLALVGHRLVDAMEEREESPHWKTIRKARRMDVGVMALLVVANAIRVISAGSPPFEDAALLVALSLAFAYEATCALVWRGTTYGKWHTQLRLVDSDGSRLSRRRALMRSVVLYVPLFIVGFLRLNPLLGTGALVATLPIVVLYSLGALHPHQRGFADLITGTQVVTKPS